MQRLIIMKKVSFIQFVAIVVVAGFPVLLWAESLEITQVKSGKTLEVSPTWVKDGKVRFSLNEKEFTVPLETLTKDSRTKLLDWQAGKEEGAADKVAKINEAVGHELFTSGQSLWEEGAGAVAKRLRWRKESVTENSSSFRAYPGAKYGFINARPYCCTLYGKEEGKVSHFSLVYANKGDYGSKVGSGEDHFESKGDLPSPSSLQDAIEHDAKAINLVLTEVLGEATEQRYGEKEDRRAVKRWDYEGHAFILSERRSEYTHLLIVPTETADNEGKVKFVKDQDLRDMLVANVVREPNGDVRIKNIPMVDQGPKGYCAPATFERAMRYMLVPADMYLLATLATKRGEGTNTQLLAYESKRIIRSKARRIKELDLDGDLGMRVVSNYIDKGVPILWQMRSLKEYNSVVNKRTKERKSVEDFSKWAQEIAEEADSLAPRLESAENYHICMIVGYNEATGELAVSDSWGPSYELRWVHLDIAKAVSTAGGFVVDL